MLEERAKRRRAPIESLSRKKLRTEKSLAVLRMAYTPPASSRAHKTLRLFESWKGSKARIGNSHKGILRVGLDVVSVKLLFSPRSSTSLSFLYVRRTKWPTLALLNDLGLAWTLVTLVMLLVLLLALTTGWSCCETSNAKCLTGMD